MPGDALFYHFLSKELDGLLKGGRIEKISMPEPDELILCIRKDRQNHNLVLSAGTHCRLHITKAAKENPASPPAFCMNLRKNIGGGVITAISEEPHERIIYIDILFKNELGIREDKRLICEIMGKYANIILCKYDWRIIECLKHIPLDVSIKRQVLPGLKYQVPVLDKLSPLEREGILKLNLSVDPHGELLKNIKGLSPVSIAEAVFNANSSLIDFHSNPTSNDINAQAKVDKDFNAAVSDSLEGLFSDPLAPCICLGGGALAGGEQKPLSLSNSADSLQTKKDFFVRRYGSQSGEYVFFDTLSEAMDSFFMQKDTASRLATKSKALSTTAKNALKRAEKRLSGLHFKLEQSMDLDKDRLFGELITANIYKIKNGMTMLSTDDYYSGESVEIPLDPLISPAANAQKFYKKYAKKKRTLDAAKEQIKKTESEKSAISQILYSLESLTSTAEIPDIYDELALLGLVKPEKNRKREKPSAPHIKEIDGFKILIGKNNIQNDRLTKNAAKDDVWLHTKSAHGSHVIIETNRRPLPDHVLLAAAGLAAYYSEAKMTDKTEVDYTLIRHVSKPSGALPGRVVYKNQKTLVVKPKALV